MNVCRVFAALFALAITGGSIHAQCGSYLRHASTQQLPYEKVHLDNAADMNADGNVDLLASQDISGTDGTRERILVIPGNGDGTFGTAISIDAPAGISFDAYYVVAKINNDSLNDIVAYNEYSTDPQTIRIYINLGNGTFTALPPTSAAGMGRAFDFADLDGDGINDYIGNQWDGGAMRYSLGNGDGTFDPPVPINSGGIGYPGDFNGDGKRDYVSHNTLYINNGNLTFTTVDLTSLFNEAIMGVRDFNGDGKSDVLVGSFNVAPKFAVLTSTGAMFTRTDYIVTGEPGVQGVTSIGGFSGNAAPDIIFTFRFENKKVLYINDGAGNFTRQDLPQRYWRGYNFLRNVQADFNADGRDDVVHMTSGITNSRIMLRDVSSITFFKNVCDRPGNPRIVDIDGTDITDWSFWNPETGDWSSRSMILGGSSGPNESEVVNWGLGSLGDIPTPGDFDGDGVSDKAVFRNTTGHWYVRRSSDLVWFVMKFGLTGDKPVVADYDGDSISDIAVWRPSDGNWYIWYMGTQTFGALHFGSDGDKPVPADFDGDLKTDVAVYRPSTGVWYYLRSTDGTYAVIVWGISTDKPVPADFDGDGKADIVVYRESDKIAYILRSSTGAASYYQWGVAGDILQIGDYDGDYVADLAVYRPSNQSWWFSTVPPWGLLVYGVPGAIPTSSIVRFE